jgi:hypothetical protein
MPEIDCAAFLDDTYSTEPRGFLNPSLYRTLGEVSLQEIYHYDWSERLPSIIDGAKNNLFNIYPMLNIKSACEDINEWNYLKSESLSRFKRLDIDNRVNAIFTIGTDNLILSIVSISANVSFSFPVLRKILTLQPREKVSEFLKIIFDFVDKTINSYLKFNVNNLENGEFTSDILVSLLNKLGEKCETGTGKVTTRDLVDFLSKFIMELGSNRNDGDTRIFSNVLFLRNLVYRANIVNLLERKQSDLQRSYERGLNTGAKFFTALKESGYKLNDDNVWIKEINLVPEFFLCQNIMYQLKPEYRIFKIEKFYFDSSRVSTGKLALYAENSNHPNTSANAVCIGDELSNRYNKMIQDFNISVDSFRKLLIDAEAALKIINFDSSYKSINTCLGEKWKDKVVQTKLNVPASDGPITSNLRRV